MKKPLLALALLAISHPAMANCAAIWTCREDMIEHVHFDTRQFNHIVWSDADDLYKKLKNRIGAVIGDGPLRREGDQLAP